MLFTRGMILGAGDSQQVVLCFFQLLEDEEKKPIRGTGYGIVTFNYEQHCKNMLRDHHRPRWKQSLMDLTLGYVTLGDHAPKIRWEVLFSDMYEV